MSSRMLQSVYTVAVALLLYSSSAVFAQQCSVESSCGSTSISANDSDSSPPPSNPTSVIVLITPSIHTSTAISSSSAPTTTAPSSSPQANSTSVIVSPITSSIHTATGTAISSSIAPTTMAPSSSPQAVSPTSMAPPPSPSISLTSTGPSASSVSPSSSPSPFSSSSTSSPVASPTPSPDTPPTLPPDAEQGFDDLSVEQQENSVTVEFTGISRDDFLQVELLFRQGIVDAVHTQLSASGQNLSADDVIFIAPCPCERSASSRRQAFDGALEVPIFIQSSEPGSAVSADAVVRAVNESGADIAQEIGATFAGVEMGVPDDVIPEEEDEDSDGGLTGGEVAAIVIVILIAVVGTVLIVVGVLILQSKRRRNYEIATNSHDKYATVPVSNYTFPVAQPDRSSEYAKLFESHPLDMPSEEHTLLITGSNEAAIEKENLSEKRPLLKITDQDTHF